MRTLLIKIIRLYQLLFSFLPPSCRFYPTCSNYAIEVISKYGIIKGVFLASLRILRCHPLSNGGCDPVR